MKIRSSYFTAAVCAALLGTLSGCSEPGLGNQSSDQATEFGTVQFPLEAVGQSGLRYRLRNAVFEIRSKRTARVEAILFSEDDFFSNFLSAELDAGEYQVMLQPGWFIEQLSDGTGGGFGSFGGGFGSSGSTGGSGGTFGSSADDGPIALSPSPNTRGRILNDAIAAPSATATGPVGTTTTSTPTTGTFTSTATNTTPTTGTFTSTATTAPTPTTTSSPTTIPVPSSTIGFPSGSGGGFIVNAALESNAIQDFAIFPREDSFVFFVFRVGDNVVSFDPGRVNIGIDIIEDGVVLPEPDLCERPADARRPAAIETAVDALQFHTLRDAFDAMANNEGFGTEGETIYQQLIDSYATADQARLPDAVHCGDETTNGEPSLNGFRMDCNRREHGQFDNLDFWQATAFVNRVDLAPQNGAHCGQQRLVFSNNVQGRMFLILEAQIPNPTPELGLQGCTPLAEFWAQSVRIEDPFERGLRLRQAFFDGTPELQDRGFGPFVSASHYTVGTGQIRTNNFDDFQWTLREFKLTTDDNALKAIPFPVAESPHGELWNDTLSHPAGETCREAFLQSLQGVLTDDPSVMAFIVPQECKNAESRNDGFTENYGVHLSLGSGEFTNRIDEAIAGTGLNALNIAERARFSGSCIGCHSESAFADLGNGVTAPFSLDFGHVGDFQTSCPDNRSACFATSPALNDTFLPHRLAAMTNLVDVPLPPSCDDDFPTEVDAGVDDTDLSGETDITDSPDESNGGTTTGAFDAGVAPGNDVVIEVPEPVELPSAEIPVEVLVELETEIRETYGDFNLGGQPAQVSH
jgi:hypothetical protein